MKAFVFRAALICEPCGESYMLANRKPEHVNPLDESSYDSDEWPKGPFDAGEADSPQHCDHCATFLQNRLTLDGLAYVREQLESGTGDESVLATWSDFYADQLSTAA